MIMTAQQIKEFDEAARPLIKYLAENFNPHITAIVTPGNAEIMSGSHNFVTDEYIKD